MPKVHRVPPGTMPKSTPRERVIMLTTPARFTARNAHGGYASSLGRMCETFAVFGVQGSPRKTGATNGEGIVLSRRFKFA